MLYKLTERLEEAASEYFKIGLNLFHKSYVDEYSVFQVPLANMAISIELLLKICIAKKCPKFLFANLPLELELKLTYPESLSELSILQERELDNFEFKSEQLKKCISIFLILYPDKKKDLKPYFDFIAEVRNNSVHSILPEFQRIDLIRTAFLAIRLVKFLCEKEIISSRLFYLSNLDREFYNKFENYRIDDLKAKIKAANEKAKTIKEKNNLKIDFSWDDRVTECPICKCDAIIEGYCDFECEEINEGDYDTSLTFISESFKCEACGLTLFDQYDLHHAGVEMHQDLSEYISEYSQEMAYIYD